MFIIFDVNKYILLEQTNYLQVPKYPDTGTKQTGTMFFITFP